VKEKSLKNNSPATSYYTSVKSLMDVNSTGESGNWSRKSRPVAEDEGQKALWLGLGVGRVENIVSFSVVYPTFWAYVW